MQQFIVLASPDGIIDMTPQAIAARTSFPLDLILKGIKILSEPDPYTRTPGEEGRRIVLLDDHRPWGWRLVNHWKYMKLRDVAQKREADRTRIAEKRNQNKDVASESQSVANVAHSDSDKDLNTTTHFEAFWTAYPRKSAKQDAVRAFEKHHFSNGELSKVLAALEAAKSSEQWRRDGGKFIPHAATWLNGRRFEDEVAVPVKPVWTP